MKKTSDFPVIPVHCRNRHRIVLCGSMADSPRILLLDDDPALLECLSEMLRLRLPAVGVEACEAPAEAMDRLYSTDYQLVISDLKMPSMDGLAVLRMVKAVRPSMPVLLITGVIPDEDVTALARRHGAIDLVSKPLERNAFIETITRILGI
jgi:DNA-binding NtrC family response regulator